MIDSLKFLPKDFTTLRPLLQIFCNKFAFPRYKLQSCIKIIEFFVSVLHFIIVIAGIKSVKFAQKFRIFLKFLTPEGTLLCTVLFVSHSVILLSYCFMLLSVVPL